MLCLCLQGKINIDYYIDILVSQTISAYGHDISLRTWVGGWILTMGWYTVVNDMKNIMSNISKDIEINNGYF